MIIVDDSGSHIAVPISGIAALYLGIGLCACVNGSQTIWVAQFIQKGILGTSATGWIASCELAVNAISVLTFSVWGTRVSYRRIAVWTSVLAAVGSALSMLASPGGIALGRLLSGVAAGTLNANIFMVVSRTERSQREFALLGAVGVVAISAMYFVSPLLAGRDAPVGLFGLIGGVAVVSAALSYYRFPSAPTSHGVQTGGGQVKPVAGMFIVSPLLFCLALSSVSIATGPLGTYLFLIGTKLGFGGTTVSATLAGATPFILVGPLVASILGERAGLVGPFLSSIGVLAAAAFCLVAAGSPLIFYLCLAAFFVGGGFYWSYGVALVTRADPSGRFTSAVPAFMLLAGASGPKLGSVLIESGALARFAVFTAFWLMVAILLVAVAVRVEARRPVVSPTL